MAATTCWRSGVRTLLPMALAVVLVAAPPSPAGAEAPASYRARVDAFWTTFRENAARYHKAIQGGEASSLAKELSALVESLLPDASWELMPGTSEGREALAIMSPSNRPQQFLLREWKRCAPTDIPWDFHMRKPAATPAARRSTMTYGGREYRAKDLMFTAEVREEDRKVDLTVFHPHFTTVDEDERATVGFVWLDWMLGEQAVEVRVGHIAFATAPSKAATGSFADLSAWFARTTKAWGPLPDPLDQALGYRDPKAAPGRGLRKDVHRAATLLKTVVERPDEDPLRGTGAVLGHLTLGWMPGAPAPTWKALRVAEQTVVDAIVPSLGALTGIALGHDFTYIDLILFDEDDALKAIRKALQSGAHAPRVSWHLFWSDGVRCVRSQPSKDLDPVPTFPEGTDGDVFRRMVASGDDLLIPRVMEFFHVVPDEEAARKMKARVKSLGLDAYVKGGDGGFDVTVYRGMRPSFETVTGLEAQLAAIAKDLGGWPEGWGGMQPGE